MKVYLAGQHDRDCYRAQATAILRTSPRVELLDPMALRDHRGREIENEAEIVEGDLRDVAVCDLVLGDYTVPGWGTGMETWFAHGLHKPIVAYVAPGARVSPWVAYVAGGYGRVHRSIDSACREALLLCASR